MMGAPQFAAMRSGAVYLNTARAALHDLDALVAALNRGTSAAAGWTTSTASSCPRDTRSAARRRGADTAHRGASYHTEQVQASMVAADLQRLLDGGRPAHIANPEVLT